MTAILTDLTRDIALHGWQGIVGLLLVLAIALWCWAMRKLSGRSE